MSTTREEHWVLGPACAPQEPPGLRMAPPRSAEALQQSNRSKARSEMARVLFGRGMLKFRRLAPILLRSWVSLKARLRARTLPTTTIICGEHHFCRYRHQDQVFPALLPVFHFSFCRLPGHQRS
jgi:hypothetical protein